MKCWWKDRWRDAGVEKEDEAASFQRPPHCGFVSRLPISASEGERGGVGGEVVPGALLAVHQIGSTRVLR